MCTTLHLDAVVAVCDGAGLLFQGFPPCSLACVQVHPPKWESPSAKPIYDLVVIGAGAGGLVTSAGASGVGAKVALIEKHLMGRL